MQSTHAIVEPKLFVEMCDRLNEIATLDAISQQDELEKLMYEYEGEGAQGIQQFYINTHYMIFRFNHTRNPTFIITSHEDCCTFEFIGADLKCVNKGENNLLWQALFKKLHLSLPSNILDHHPEELLKYLHQVCNPELIVTRYEQEFHDQLTNLSVSYFTRQTKLPRLMMLAACHTLVTTASSTSTGNLILMKARYEIMQSIYLPELGVSVTDKMIENAGFSMSSYKPKKITDRSLAPSSPSDLNDSYQEIYDRFTDSDWVFSYLKKLDKELSKLLTPDAKRRLVKVNKYTIKYLTRDHACSPVVSDDFDLPKTNSFLRKFFEGYLKEYDLLIEGQLPRAAGFLSSDLFEKIMAFLENYKWMGTTLNHDKFAHLIQLWIMCEAIKEGQIKIPTGMSIAEFIKRLFKDRRSDDTINMFSALFDFYGEPHAQSPGYLSGLAIRQTDKKYGTPVLAACLINSRAKGVRKNKLIHGEKLSTLQVTLLQFFAANKFMVMDNDAISRIRDYYIAHDTKLRMVTLAPDGSGFVVAKRSFVAYLSTASVYIKIPTPSLEETNTPHAIKKDESLHAVSLFKQSEKTIENHEEEKKSVEVKP